MRKLIFLFFGVLAMHVGLAQTDTTIYQIVEEMPRFPACEQLDTTVAFKQKCANQAMLQYVYNQIVYPQEAIEQNISGTAVVSFVIEKDGSISNPKIVKDLGGGTGIAALGVVLNIKEQDVRWVPGKQKGEIVRVEMTLPVRFKLEDPDPFIIVGRDTVYTVFDSPIEYEGGADALQTYVDNKLGYPESGTDSCLVGQIDMSVLIEADGNVRILDMVDFNLLGFDFWYSAIETATSTYGKWTPATFEGRAVNASFDISFAFLPEAESCTLEVDKFMAARTLANEGSILIDEGDVEEGLAKITEALAQYPLDAQFRIMRGQAFLENNQLNEACFDLAVARQISLVKWFDSILPLICK